MNEAHGGDRIAEVLVRHGVRHLFALCGGHISPILTGAHARNIAVIDVRDEANAVFAADAVATLGVIAAIALFHVETSAANYDPQYMRVLVERTMRYGGTYYENGIHNKGPLEPVIYEVAGRLGGRDGFWFVIAVFTMIASAIIGAASALVAVTCGAPRIIGWSVATAVVAHLMLSEADYAGVLYSRNITVTLLSVAVLVALSDSMWKTRAVGHRCRGGLGTGLRSCRADVADDGVPRHRCRGWAIWRRRHERVRGRPVWLVLPAVSLAVLLSAPLWYLMRGAWTPFIEGWWTYAEFMSTATGRGLGEQLGLGWDQLRHVLRRAARGRRADRGLPRGGCGPGGWWGLGNDVRSDDAVRMVVGSVVRADPEPAVLLALLLGTRRADPP